ncbi:MAG TPA: stage II sporulation protein E [Bacillota bacterium]|nr:stage II sporulation protein E [Bacillota bacterium]
MKSVATKEFDTDVSRWHVFLAQFNYWLKGIFIDRGWLLMLVGVLLGRAVILAGISPFAVAFFATVWCMHRKDAVKVMFALFIGAMSYSMIQSVFIGISLIIFLLLATWFTSVKNHIKIPVFVFLSIGLARLFIFSIIHPLHSYEWIMLCVEGVLGTILVLIFMQSVHLLSPERYKPTLKNEEIVCMIILIASMLTGMIGWSVYEASIEHIFSRYFVLILAFVGGAAIGSTVGVVAGLVLSLAHVANMYQMGVLAFSGLLGGLLKEGNKLGVSVGLLIGTLLIGIYGETGEIFPSTIESLIAIVLFILTPASWFKQLARYIPGTAENTEEQEQYLQKVRNVTAKRVEQFSDVFNALSLSFSTPEEEVLNDNRTIRETDEFLSRVTEQTCQQCFMKERCWQKELDTTYTLMGQLKDQIESSGDVSASRKRAFENHCIRSSKVIDVMKEKMLHYNAHKKLKQQVVDSKRLVADQLQGVAEVMDDFAKEIVKEREYHERQEKQIIHAMNHLGIELDKLDIYQLDKGNIDIEMTASFYEYRGEGAKLIAPVLSDILNELVVVKKEETSPFPNGYCSFTFGSARQYTLDIGVAHAAKGGGLVSGDSYTMMELGEGKFALAISDGMGNGHRAREESEETLRLLQQILQTGIPEHIAIKSINSILSLRTTEEIFATLDLAVINLHSAAVRFLKIGSTPSFIKRGGEMIDVEASNLPMGMIEEFDVDIVKEQLRAGDYICMMSDGIFDGPQHVKNPDAWVRQKIQSIDAKEPQSIADVLLEEVIRTRSGDINDDMTVLIAKISKNTPMWSSIPIQAAEAKPS